MWWFCLSPVLFSKHSGEVGKFIEVDVQKVVLTWKRGFGWIKNGSRAHFGVF